MANARIRKITYTALLFAMGILLPRAVHMIPIGNIGSMLCPMHIPVLLCGFIVGWKYAGLIGLLLPLVSFMLTGTPPILPTGVSMMVELMTYGISAALLYKFMNKNVYPSLIGAMLLGRIAMGIARFFIFGAMNLPYGLAIFVSSAFITSIPGIILHILIIPLVVNRLKYIYETNDLQMSHHSTQ